MPDHPTLRLTGFRRFGGVAIELRSPTVIIGPNGAGKTTILEAIYFLSLGRSYRTSVDRDMIGWHTDTARAQAVFPDGLRLERAISTFGGTVRKQSLVNEIVTTPLDSLGHLCAVLFAPELVELVVGPPKARRRYLDMLLSATDRTYAEALLRYQHALKQRNALLVQRTASPASFESWEQLLAAAGSEIMAKRAQLTGELETAVQAPYALFEGDERARSITIDYLPAADPADRFAELLASSRDRDSRQGATSVGPHRDDLLIQLGGKPMTFASRGEQRSLLIALKHAEVLRYAARPLPVPPYLLLDDLFSELDRARSSQLTGLLAQFPTIVTTTDATALDARLLDSATVLDLSQVQPEVQYAA